MTLGVGLQSQLVQSPREILIESMSRTVRTHIAVKIATDQRQIADAVENFVPDAFVDDAQFVIDDSTFAEHENVLSGDTRAETLGLEGGDF